MPDITKRKALEEQEKKQKQEKLSEVWKDVKAVEKIPKRELEWAGAPKHPAGGPRAVPLPNHTGGKPEVTPLPLDVSKPIRIEKLPYLIDATMRAEEQTGGMINKPSIPSRHEVH